MGREKKKYNKQGKVIKQLAIKTVSYYYSDSLITLNKNTAGMGKHAMKAAESERYILCLACLTISTRQDGCLINL